MMRVTLRDSNKALVEIVVTGKYNPDILDDVQRRVIRTYNEYQGITELTADELSEVEDTS